MQLAYQLGLHTRQVAIWFQNRRARWKTKQLERDFLSLQNRLESLKADRDVLIKEKESLEAEVLSLRNEVNNKGREKHAEEPTSVSPFTESCSCVAVTDAKENEGFPITDDSEGSATNTAGSPSLTQNSVAATSTGDMEMKSETITLIELPDLYSGRTVYDPGSIKEEDIFYGELDNGNGFVTLDWWAAS